MRNSKWMTVFALLLVAAISFADDKPTTKPAAKPSAKALEGKPAPEFVAETLDGKHVSLADQKGKVVVIEFWASWCPYCKQFMPNLQTWSEDKTLTDNGLVVWGIDTFRKGETKEKGQAAATERGYTMTIPLDPDDLAMSRFQAGGLPTVLVIGRDGIVKKASAGYTKAKVEAIKAAIDEALKEPAPTKAS